MVGRSKDAMSYCRESRGIRLWIMEPILLGRTFSVLHAFGTLKRSSLLYTELNVLPSRPYSMRYSLTIASWSFVDHFGARKGEDCRRLLILFRESRESKLLPRRVDAKTSCNSSTTLIPTTLLFPPLLPSTLHHLWRWVCQKAVTRSGLATTQ